MQDENILNALLQVRADLAEMEISFSDAKAERKSLRQAITAGNTITMIIESYHGFPWADEIGTETMQATTKELVRRESHINREIAKYKAAIKTMTKNMESYDVRAKQD